MYEVEFVDLALNRMGFEEDLIYKVVSESVYSGEPYIEACARCNSEYYVCVFTKVTPVDVEKYSVYLVGVSVTVDKDKVVDRVVEELLLRSRAVKYCGSKASFYIPIEFAVYVFSKLCSSSRINCSGSEGPEVRAASLEDVSLFSGDENDIA